MGEIKPTEEQDAFIDAGKRGEHIAGEAGAGTGKTTTGRFMTEQMRGQGLYAAYNKAIAVAAKGTFPRHVDCRTVHSLAFRAVGVRYSNRLNGPRQPAREVARLLRINQAIPLGGGAMLQPTQIARLASETVARFCRTMDEDVNWWHVPKLALASEEVNQYIRPKIVPYARRIWADLQLDDENGGGQFRYVHDHYLKQWVMTRPTLPYDFIVLDEAQDADPLIAALVMGQQNHAQLIGIGDQNQAIYGWRGACNALANWPGRTRLFLTESWRFGPEVADEANKWLTVLNASLRLVGKGGPSRIGAVGAADAVLCRTNATAMGQAMTALAAGKKVALVGGGQQIRQLAEAAIDLKQGRGTGHPELCVFRTWQEVQDYVAQEHDGSDLKTAVKLIEDHGAEEVIEAIDRLVPDRPGRGQSASRLPKPDVVVSTAHKAKGLDWPRVRVADDFRDPGPDEDMPREDAMLAYVTVTRAKNELERGSLAFIDKRPELIGWS